MGGESKMQGEVLRMVFSTLSIQFFTLFFSIYGTCAFYPEGHLLMSAEEGVLDQPSIPMCHLAGAGWWELADPSSCFNSV
jgi:hypothetical protein